MTISDHRHFFLSSKTMAIGIFHAKFKVEITKIKRHKRERLFVFNAVFKDTILHPKHVYLAI